MKDDERKGHPVGEGVGAAGGAVAGGVAGHGVAGAVQPSVGHQHWSRL